MPPFARMRGRAGASVAPPSGYPLGVLGRPDEEAAWDTQFTAGLTNEGALVTATTGNLPGGTWTQDADGFHSPTTGIFELADRLFLKPVTVRGTCSILWRNNRIIPDTPGANFCLSLALGSTANVDVEDAEFDATNVGISRSGAFYQLAGTVTGKRSRLLNAALNHMTLAEGAVSSAWEDSYFAKFGCKAVAFPPPDNVNNSHCEGTHVRVGGLILTRVFYDNRGNVIPAATVTAAGTYCEAQGSGVVSTCTHNAVVVDGVTEANAPYAVVLNEDTGGQSSMTINGGAYEPGSSGFLSKGSGAVLAGSGSLNLNTGALLTPPYG